MKGYTQGTATCFFWMNEDELLRMSAAIVDAGLYTGSSIFVTKYIEPNIQEASVVNYTPSLSILTLLENDPNILDRVIQKLNREVRKSLENRLADSLATDVSSIKWDVGSNIHMILSPTPIPNQDTQVTVTPTPMPATPQNNNENSQPESQISETIDTPGFEKELGQIDTSDQYFYLAEKNAIMKGDIEYGE